MKITSQIICGIDPGLQRTGYGVVAYDEATDRTRLVDAGVIRPSRATDLAIRLAELAAGLDEVLDEHRPGVMAVEQIYSHYQRPRTAILMAHARGIYLLEAARRDMRVIHLPSTTVKKHLTGNGRASKEQVQRAVAHVLELNQAPQPSDVADALAVALCAAEMLRRPARMALLNDDLLVPRGAS